ncbi:MAG TPA: nucleotidyltransferase family protein [Clostridiales bacterium]|nr:nucleotidyltransferase family protein [Clostridiales bacterium]
MKAIILAAGYATRLYPLTQNMPKALLQIGSKAILDHILENVMQIEEVDEVFIVTNDKFYKNFVDWRGQRDYSLPIIIYNDGTTSEANRLGALGDLKFVLDKSGISDDIIVLAADNLMDFSLLSFYDFYRSVDSNCVCVKEIKPSEAGKMGIVLMDEDNRIYDFEEKPKHPKSNIGAYAVYIYKKETLKMLDEYLKAGNNPDAPGNFPAWLCKREPVYGYVFNGSCYDIGTHDAYEEVQKLYAHI